MPEHGQTSQAQKMAAAALKPEPVKPQESTERKIVLLLCLLGAVHVFIFSAAFPFFNNVDEGMHFDLILRYAHGDVPRQIELIRADSASYLGLMVSHEYYETAVSFQNHQFPPPLWTIPAGSRHSDLASRSEIWQTLYNYEVSQPPLYYTIAALWWHIGEWLGLHDGRLVYWLRFLNVGLIFGLVWLGYAAARLIFPENLFLKLGVPAVVAFMPQSEFYSLGNDMISSLCFGVAFICVIRWLRAERPSVGLGVTTGLALAATFLAKGTNLPLLAVAIAVIVFKVRQDARQGRIREKTPALAALLVSAELPTMVWIIWCKVHFGDPTGSAVKTQFLGWTIKPIGQWWHHPIFSPGGLWIYLSGQMGTFWQGELWWHGQRLCLPGTDTIYTLLSIVLVGAALPALWPRYTSSGPERAQALQFGLACFVAGLAFFGLMSIAYDYHGFHNPSREHPYFEAGRMILGALIPFLLLFLCGLDRLLNRFGVAVKLVTLVVMISAMLALEITTDWPVFGSAYNWFHLP